MLRYLKTLAGITSFLRSLYFFFYSGPEIWAIGVYLVSKLYLDFKKIKSNYPHKIADTPSTLVIDLSKLSATRILALLLL